LAQVIHGASLQGHETFNFGCQEVKGHQGRTRLKIDAETPECASFLTSLGQLTFYHY